MLERLRNRSAEEAGLTVVDLLVVMLILGIVATISLPSFLRQREQDVDADAKSSARTAQIAMDRYAERNDGDFAGVAASGADLAAIDETLGSADLTVSYPTDAPSRLAGEPAFQITATSDTGNTFSITRDDAGRTALTCTGGGGCIGGEW